MPQLWHRERGRGAVLRELRLRLHHRQHAAAPGPAGRDGRRTRHRRLRGAGRRCSASAPGSSSPDAGFSWVVELWIDPSWYEAQDSPDPLPSPGLPDTIPLRKTSVLVGRASRSRGIHPDVDCGGDSGVSRRQAQLTGDGSRWYVEDLESANGTFIGSASGVLPENPIPVGVKRELGADDRIYVGAWTRLVLREATEDEIASLG